MKNLLVLLLVFGVVAYGTYMFTDLLKGAVVTAINPSTSASAPVAESSGGTTTAGRGVKCFRCDGTGFIKCPNPECHDGTIECPGPCLRLTKGEWVHMDVAGHPPTDVWQVFRYRTATESGTKAWSQAHVGEVIEMVDGMPTNKGKCSLCHGTTRVPCLTCKGTAHIVCPVCHGEKVLAPQGPAGSSSSAPAGASSAADPGVKTYVLKDGTTVTGKIVLEDDDATIVRTSDDRKVRFLNKDLMETR